jgi:hypothetical protein
MTSLLFLFSVLMVLKLSIFLQVQSLIIYVFTISHHFDRHPSQFYFRFKNIIIPRKSTYSNVYSRKGVAHGPHLGRRSQLINEISERLCGPARRRIRGGDTVRSTTSARECTTTPHKATGTVHGRLALQIVSTGRLRTPG